MHQGPGYNRRVQGEPDNRCAGGRWRLAITLAVILAGMAPALVSARAAFGQGSGVPGDVPPGSESFRDPDEEPAEGERTAPVAGERGRGTGEVTLAVRTIGMGGKARAGEWVGVRVDVTDTGSQTRNVLIQAELPDSDGDTLLSQRVIATTPGDRRSVWLYLRIPASWAAGGETLPVVAYEAEETGAGDISPAAGRAYRAGRLLGSTTFLIQQNLTAGRSLVGVVGTSMGGLDQYNWPALKNEQYPPTGHEHTEVTPGLAARDVPDRWMGLAAFDVLVWTGNDPSLHHPRLLEGDAPGAIEEWVQRGGHLVVMLPSIGQTWYTPSGQTDHLLKDILPRVRVERREGVSLEPLRSLLTRDRKAPLPESVVVQTLTPENAGPFEAMPIMTGPDGAVVVARRLLGSGAVTVVGLDTTHPKLRDVSASLQADHFWHRVLGKRLALPTPAKLDEDMKGKPGSAPAWSSQVVPEIYEAVIPAAISKSASAAAGVLLALVVFALYWLIAGPLGYFGLRRRGWIQHAWVGFGAATVVFTAVAWTGASALKIRRVEGQHLTLLDAVYGQTTQRARSWISLFLPAYGEQRVSVASSDGRVHNALTPWDAPLSVGGSGFAAFPDARGYAMASRGPDTIRFPSRATVKQVQADWLGAVPGTWGLPVPTGAGSAPVGGEVRLVAREPVVDETLAGRPRSRDWAVEGTLTHNLPRGLKDVRAVLVLGQSAPARGGEAGALQAEAFSVVLPSGFVWEPGTAVAVDQWFKPIATDMRADKDLENLRGRPTSALNVLGAVESSRDTVQAMMALSFFDQLTPPAKFDADSRTLPRRQSTYGYDLSRWFTQPCLMILGVMENSELPVPVTVDDLPADQVRERVRGTTIVRWIFPLTARPVQGVGAGGEADAGVPAGTDPASADPAGTDPASTDPADPAAGTGGGQP